MAFERSDSILALLRKQLGLDEEVPVVMQAWERELGALAPYAKVAAIRRGTLYVEAASSVHLQELTLRKHDIVRKINQYFGGKRVVKDLRIALRGKSEDRRAY